MAAKMARLRRRTFLGGAGLTALAAIPALPTAAESAQAAAPWTGTILEANRKKHGIAYREP